MFESPADAIIVGEISGENGTGEARNQAWRMLESDQVWARKPLMGSHMIMNQEVDQSLYTYGLWTSSHCFNSFGIKYTTVLRRACLPAMLASQPA